MPRALQALADALQATAAEYKERLAPAIERVWGDEIAALGRDLRVWIRKLPDAAPWTPEYFEYSFGLDDEGRDARSRREPVRIDGRFILRGSVDLIETRAGLAGAARSPITRPDGTARPRSTVIGGGGTLQPVIYGLAVEQISSDPSREGRLFYATTGGRIRRASGPALRRQSSRRPRSAGDHRPRDRTRVPPAAPAERACTWCDFRSICGPDEPRHVARKAAEPLADLLALRRDAMTDASRRDD